MPTRNKNPRQYSVLTGELQTFCIGIVGMTAPHSTQVGAKPVQPRTISGHFGIKKLRNLTIWLGVPTKSGFRYDVSNPAQRCAMNVTYYYLPDAGVLYNTHAPLVIKSVPESVGQDFKEGGG